VARRRRSRGAPGLAGAAALAAALAFGWLALGRAPRATQVAAAPARAGVPAGPGKQRVGTGKPPRPPNQGAALAGPFGSLAACEAAVRGKPHRAKGAPPRIGTWNIRWFPRGSAKGDDPDRRTDVAWLACAIASLEVDVLAMQEIVQDPQGRAALLDLQARLDARTGGRWQAHADACPGSGRQHVGLLFDASRVELDDAREIAALNPGDGACALNLRPGFGARARFGDGTQVDIVTLHLDSGLTPRDHDHRVQSWDALRGVVAAGKGSAGVIVLGDFNTMGCKQCEPKLDAQSEVADLDARIETSGLRRLSPAAGHVCSHYYDGHAGLLDHVLVTTAGSRSLAERARLEVHGVCEALACEKPARGARPDALERLSDHCPLVVQLEPARGAHADAKRPARPVTAHP